jgi:hypothetical protein
MREEWEKNTCNGISLIATLEALGTLLMNMKAGLDSMRGETPEPDISYDMPPSGVALLKLIPLAIDEVWPPACCVDIERPAHSRQSHHARKSLSRRLRSETVQ